MLTKAFLSRSDPGSQIEGSLADFLQLHSSAKWFQQVEIITPFSRFYPDMSCLVRKDHAIAVECDGRDYHGDPVKELCRDALILNTGRIKRMYHIQAWAIKKRQIDWLHLLAQAEPELFSPERHETIKGLLDGYNRVTSSTPRSRRFGFMFCRSLESEEVKDTIAFAMLNKGVSYDTLLQRMHQRRIEEAEQARRQEDEQ